MSKVLQLMVVVQIVRVDCLMVDSIEYVTYVILFNFILFFLSQKNVTPTKEVKESDTGFNKLI